MSAPVSAYNRKDSSSSVSSTSSSVQNERRSSSVASGLKAVGHRLAQHHREVNAAYEAFYGVGSRPQDAPSYRPRKSEESQRALIDEDHHYEVEARPAAEKKQDSKSTKKVWQRVKQHAKEHHEGVNAAYRAYYGVS
ncbi:hypothetical protein NA57DRAFT_51208 [Rhizodiscina lignyota]|uniref:Uncharacterized protein n=1 Tax=Rhizodiscina lignyota TaxID=1504668 RepID=A0A9P4MGC3_9PEZI|nr:hypothetical protein NA57DRAFT_51208 [Rhizodiscina lignyota]